jgi:hypothetical protein
MKQTFSQSSLDAAQRNQGMALPGNLDFASLHQGYDGFIEHIKRSPQSPKLRGGSVD